MFTELELGNKISCSKKPTYDYALPFVNFGAKFQPNSFNVHRIETLCLQHTLARFSLILRKPRLSSLSTLPCYVSLIKLDSTSSLKSSSNLKGL